MLRLVAVTFAVVVLAGIVAFLVWAWTPARPGDTALSTPNADERVEVIEQDGT